MGETFATTASVSCHSVTLTWPAASSSVLEYGVWHGLFSTAPDQLQRYHAPEAQNVGENLLEVGGLEPGTEYLFVVRVRTVHGWREHTSPLSETTLTPSDFPLPLLAPEVVAFVGCEAVKLRLPVLRYCVTRMHTALQHREGGTGSWRMLRDRVLGGIVDIDHLSPYATHEFRLLAFVEGAEGGGTPGAVTPPLLTDMVAARLLLAAPSATATSSASYRVSWAADSQCRPHARWRVLFRRFDAELDEQPRPSGRRLSGSRLLSLRPGPSPPPPPPPPPPPTLHNASM